MIRTVPLTPEMEIIFQGKKNGLDIYKSATNVITIRPGSLHIHNGYVNYIFQTTEWNTIDMTSGNDSDGVAYTTSWYFVTVDKDGTFRTHVGTGANTVRPSDTAYSWVDDDNTGFKHDKQGYYYSESERIIGAVYRSTDIDYIINNYDITNEEGENGNGHWIRKNGKIMEQWAVNVNITVTSSGGFVWFYPINYPDTTTVYNNAVIQRTDARIPRLIPTPTANTTKSNDRYTSYALVESCARDTSEQAIVVDFYAIGTWR